MYFLRVKESFSAALYLSNCHQEYKGMHGHDFDVTASLKSNTLTSVGMVYDYNSVKQALGIIARSLDHVLLNDQSEFMEKNPTAENIAKYFYESLQLSLKDIPLFQIEIALSRGVTASYRSEN